MKVTKSWLSGIFAPLILAAMPLGAAIPAHPGMLNYVEGQVRINGQVVTNRDVGTADVRDGQIVETGQGRAEFLLTPGVFLRLGDNTRIQMDATGLTDTRLTVLEGKAFIEADYLRPENNIRVMVNGSVTRLEKNGMYRFEPGAPQVAVFDGRAQVTENDRSVDLGKGREANVDHGLQTAKFDTRSDANDPLYQWSAVRSQYLAAADIQQARTVVVNNAGWYGGGWYWNPWYAMYAWVPGNGIYYSPFGWGFYSPFTVWAVPAGYFHGIGGYHGYAGYRGFAAAPRMRGGSGRR
jgi:hypothetical protein